MRPPLRDTTIGASTLTVVEPTSTPSGNERSGLGPWRSAEPPPGWNPFPDDAVGGSVAQRFLHTASRFPDKEALSSPAGSWTFAQLAADATGQAGAIASLLDESGPRPVALLITHDGPLVIALLSIILAGHIVVVVDPQAPQAEQLHVLAESGANLVLADYANAEVAAVLTAGSEQVAVRKLDELEPSHYEVPSTGPDHPIMLAFTSGTSGESKAAVVTNAVLLNLIRGATNALGIGPDDRMPMLFPTSLAVAAYPMFLPLLNGGTLATLDVRSVGLDPVADFLADERITLAYMAPTVVRFLVDALADRSFPDLRMIALGGEVVDAEVVELTRQLLGPRHIANGFGTTETGVITLYVLDADGDPDGEVPAGYPVPEVEVMILDDSGDEVPTGEAGEVAIASPHVFSGYWGHHDVDQLVLGPDPSGRDGWSHYRTGDLGRVNNDGALVVLGRLDAKVKVRGRFVVLGDVEADLHVIDGVRDAAVISRSDHGVTELDAWVALIDGSQRTGSELRAELLKDREAYRVPSKWHLVEDLPRLPNGKLDRQALRRPQTKPATGSGQGSETDHHNDIGGTTRQLRDIWEALLPGAVVGLDDDFAHLGGDSLLAAQMLVISTSSEARRPPRWYRRVTPSDPACGSSTTFRGRRTESATWRRRWATTNRCGASNRRCCAASRTRSPSSIPLPPGTSGISEPPSPWDPTGWPGIPLEACAPTRLRASSVAMATRWPFLESSTSAPATGDLDGVTNTRPFVPGSVSPSRPNRGLPLRRSVHITWR